MGTMILRSEEQQRLWSRLPGEDERVLTVSGGADVPAAQARAYLEATRAKQEGSL